MYILGIHPAHNSTAALLKDGRIIACASEERFVRVKNFWGFPFNSVKYVLDFAEITPKDIDLVVISCKSPIGLSGKKFDMFKIVKNAKTSMINQLFGYMSYKHPWTTEKIIQARHMNKYSSLNEKHLIAQARKEISKFLSGIDQNKILFIDHHFAHSYAPCFNLSRKEKTIVFSIDGEGDYATCATVNIFDGTDLKRIAETKKEASLGYLYALTTFHLGMKPNEHEFKVMGLAPYAKQDKVDEIYPLLKETLWVEGLNFKSKFRMQYFEYFLKDKMRNVRFDTLAAAVQKLTEEILCKWIKNAIAKTGIPSIALTGGVAMNVKACQKISELKEVKKIFVMPSAADESTAIGACYYGQLKHCRDSNLDFLPVPIEDIYLGPEYSEEEIKKFLKENKYNLKYNITKVNDIEKDTARLLAKGEIVARLSGRSEWGARALGNRSILSNPGDKECVRILNELIKDRDFWMPFTPSILQESGKEYILNPKKIPSPYMVITFDSTKKAQKEIQAAIHPYDFTVRPQIVYPKWNPKYYKMLKEFKKITGIGAVLNTSFNLHGEPNVLSPKDAMHTFENSGLKFLAMGNFLISKK